MERANANHPRRGIDTPSLPHHGLDKNRLPHRGGRAGQAVRQPPADVQAGALMEATEVEESPRNASDDAA